MTTNGTRLNISRCPEFDEAATRHEFRPATELSDNELSDIIESISAHLLNASPPNGWTVLLGVTTGPEFGSDTCCRSAPGGLVLLTDVAVLHTVRLAPLWRRHRDGRLIYAFHADPQPTGRLHRSPAA